MPSVASEIQEHNNRLESDKLPLFNIENLPAGSQFKAIVFAKVSKGNKPHPTPDLGKLTFLIYAVMCVVCGILSSVKFQRSILFLQFCVYILNDTFIGWKYF